jgi:hypothetical protein
MLKASLSAIAESSKSADVQLTTQYSPLAAEGNRTSSPSVGVQSKREAMVRRRMERRKVRMDIVQRRVGVKVGLEERWNGI